MKQKSLDISNVKCPPCNFIVKRQCIGLHEKYDMKCNENRIFDCKRKCGNPLACGNHTCELSCHLVTLIRDNRKIQLDENDFPTKSAFSNFKISFPVNLSKQEEYIGNPLLSDISEFFIKKYKETCLPCELPCQKKRVPFCKHPCTLPCHPEVCPPCAVLVRKFCHCPLRTLKVMKCFETNISKS